jgi:hypothetical protein
MAPEILENVNILVERRAVIYPRSICMERTIVTHLRWGMSLFIS